MRIGITCDVKRLHRAALRILERLRPSRRSAAVLACLGHSEWAVNRKSIQHSLFEEAMASDDDQGFVRLTYARVLADGAGSDSGMLRRSVKLYTEALEIFRSEGDRVSLVDCLVGLGCCAMKAGNSEAQTYFTMALEHEPDMFEAVYGVGVCKALQEDWEPAAEYLLRAVGINRQDANARYELANTLCFLNLCPEADIHFAAALRLGYHDRPRALYGRAYCAYKQERRRAARRFAKAALRLDANYDKPQILLAELDDEPSARADRAPQ